MDNERLDEDPVVDDEEEEFSASDNGPAVAGFVLALAPVLFPLGLALAAATISDGLGDVVWILAFSPILPLLGLILSIVGLNRAGQVGGQGRGLAIAGIVISTLFLLFLLFWLIVVGAFWWGWNYDHEVEINEPSVSSLVVKQFNADEASRSVLVASGDISQIETASGQIRYRPTTPETCRYLVSTRPENRSAFDIDQRLVTYSDQLLITPEPVDIDSVRFLQGEEHYVLADGCGDWRLVDQLAP